jgi:hypothetical protein
VARERTASSGDFESSVECMQMACVCYVLPGGCLYVDCTPGGESYPERSHHTWNGTAVGRLCCVYDGV